MEKHILRARPGTRAKLAGLLVLTFLVATAVYFWLVPHWRDVELASSGEAFWYLKAIMFSLSVLHLPFMLYFANYARKIYRYDQSPPPGTWVIRDTPIVRGGRAKVHAALFTVLSLLFLAAAIYMAAFPFLVAR